MLLCCLYAWKEGTSDASTVAEQIERAIGWGTLLRKPILYLNSVQNPHEPPPLLNSNAKATRTHRYPPPHGTQTAGAQGKMQEI